MKTIFVVAAHPDYEVLGCGGLISKIKDDGGKVYVLIFNVGSVEKYDNRKFTEKRKKGSELGSSTSKKGIRVKSCRIEFSNDEFFPKK